MQTRQTLLFRTVAGMAVHKHGKKGKKNPAKQSPDSQTERAESTGIFCVVWVGPVRHTPAASIGFYMTLHPMRRGESLNLLSINKRKAGG